MSDSLGMRMLIIRPSSNLLFQQFIIFISIYEWAGVCIKAVEKEGATPKRNSQLSNYYMVDLLVME